MSWFSKKWKQVRNKVKDVAKRVGRAVKKGTGYYAIRKWADNGPLWKQLLGGSIHPAAGNHYTRNKASEWGYKTGEWIGEHLNDRQILFLSITTPFLGTVHGLDIYTNGAVSDGYTSTFFDDEVYLNDFNATWDNYPALELFSWYPGSVEWSEFATGGLFYNATQPLEPWQRMLNINESTDSFGMMTENMFDLDNPASPDMKYAGSGFYENFD